MNSIKILIVDDHPMIRQGMQSLLEDVDNINVLAEASNGLEALELVDKQEFDLIIMDIKMPELNGIETTEKIKMLHPHIKVLAISMYDEQRFIVRMLQAGAAGYVLKNTTKEELLQAINTIMSGESYFSQEVSSIMLSQFMGKSTSNVSENIRAEVTLTKRETEIIKLIADENTNSEIADKLGISPRTVDTHRRNLLQKLDVKNTAGLVKYAIQYNILDV